MTSALTRRPRNGRPTRDSARRRQGTRPGARARRRASPPYILALQKLKAELEAEVARLSTALNTSDEALKSQTDISVRAVAQVELLNRQIAEIRTQLEELNKALAVARTDLAVTDLKIEDLGRELNLALAARVQELNRYRSEFFGRLRAVLGNRPDVQIVGDRFVFSSEVLFPSASDEVSEDGLRQLLSLAETLKSISAEMPADLPWVLEVEPLLSVLAVKNSRSR